MKKYTVCFLCFAFISTACLAQSRYISVDAKDGPKPTIVNEYPFSEKTVENAIDDKMQKAGYKGRNSKGFTVYKGVTLSEFGTQAYDMYFKVDRKSKRDKENSSVNLMLTKGDEKFITEDDDASTIRNAKSFLDDMAVSIEAYDLEQQISSQENDVKKAEKKYQNLLDDADKLQRSKKRIENDIENNISDQKKQQDEIEKQKQIFDTLKGKRKA